MEVLMMDMMTEPELAEFVLDTVTEHAVIQAQNYVLAGADGIFLGDDIGMQFTPMMSLELYREFLKPRLAKVISAAREIKPDVIVVYHSCGHATPYIPDLIEAGVDVLNPVQPESMNFEEILETYRGRLSYCGVLGTQTLMPFGSPEEVYETTTRYLDLVGPQGGLLACPTHVLEPEVPVENVVAYLEACRNYHPGK
jgi:uroporphyrinogen decarboxylase